MDTASLRAFRTDSRTMVRELGFLRDQWAPAGIAHAQCHLLMELAHAGQLSPGDLAERLRSDPAVISRSVKALMVKGLLQAQADPADKRRRILALTEAGMTVVRGIHDDADSQVRQALAVLDPGSQQRVLDGMQLYAKALRRARLQQELRVRPIRPGDDPAVTALIRTVMPEFGASGPGFAITDPEVDGMYEAYQAPRCEYWVIERQGRVVGGGGYAPLSGGDGRTCELRKMYFLPELRGLGMGSQLLQRLLQGAAAEGYRTCYLETLECMTRAQALYEGAGFQRLEAAMGDTGHFGCDRWYARSLEGVGAPA